MINGAITGYNIPRILRDLSEQIDALSAEQQAQLAQAVQAITDIESTITTTDGTLAAHTANTGNPHLTTALQAGAVVAPNGSPRPLFDREWGALCFDIDNDPPFQVFDP
jgi:hypothetical protein